MSHDLQNVDLFRQLAESISERQRIANELQSSEARLRAIFESQPDCISVVSLDGRVTAINPAGLAMLDADRHEQVLGRPFLEFIHPGDREAVQRMHQEVCAGEKQTLVFRVVGLHGRERLLETHAVPLQEGLHAVSHLAVTRDITERKRVEKALRDSERQLRTVLDHAPWIVMTVDQQGMITFINRGHNQRPLEGLLGDTCYDHVAPQFQQLVKDALARAFEQGENWRCDLPSPDGLWWDAQIIPLSRDGATPSALVIADDVSERRRADQRLREIELQLAHASRLSTMGEMLAGIAHELNQPLFAIGNFAGASQQTLKDLNVQRTPQLADVRRWLEAIETSVARAGEIMRRLRRFVRRDDGLREKVDLCQVVRDAVEMLAFQAREFQINIDLELPNAPATVLAVRVEMQQVLVNLIRNGIEAARGQPPARRWLHVALTDSSEDVLVSVLDLGEGVPAADAARVFDPFFTTKPDGLGLGLPISKSIVESHGGRIWHAPSAAGGSDFRFVLPRERRSQAT